MPGKTIRIWRDEGPRTDESNAPASSGHASCPMPKTDVRPSSRQLRRPVSWQGFANCTDCSVRRQSLFAHLSNEEIAAIHYPIDEIRLKPGAALFAGGDRADYLYTVRDGLLKTSLMGSDRRHRVTGLRRAGDLVGLPAWLTGHYDSTATAVLPTRLCRLPIAGLRKLEQQSPRFVNALQKQWSASLAEAQHWFIDLTDGPVSQRLARLLLRFPRDSGDRIAVCSRREMGEMLGGVTFETVSRNLSAFVREGTLVSEDSQGRHYRVDRRALHRAANWQPDDASDEPAGAMPLPASYDGGGKYPSAGLGQGGDLFR